MKIICDGHAHLGTPQEREYRREQGIVTMICAEDAAQAGELSAMDGDWIVKACGLHPWKADLQALRDMEPWLSRTKIIGEIGLDSVWCQVDMDVQREVFERQLEIASERGKPVVLHVKGMEREAAERIRRHPGRYLVHWYSDLEWLDLYLEQDCYFSVGPDVAVNPAVQQVARRADLSRLLVETDGFGAVRWALGEDFPLDGLRGVLERSLDWIADEKGVDRGKVREIAEDNFRRFSGLTLTPSDSSDRE